jgi:hypothetical protein
MKKFYEKIYLKCPVIWRHLIIQDILPRMIYESTEIILCKEGYRRRARIIRLFEVHRHAAQIVHNPQEQALSIMKPSVIRRCVTTHAVCICPDCLLRLMVPLYLTSAPS